MISEMYRALNRELHAVNAEYGTSGRVFADLVAALCKRLGTRDVLDYGCGKRTLESALGFPITNYDPCIPGLDQPPHPSDIVVCTEVLEHIEPEHLDAVLSDLARLTNRCVFLSVATTASSKFLSDGRNSHLIQRSLEWWQPKLEKAFRLSRCFGTTGGFVFIGESFKGQGEFPDLSEIGPPPTVKTIRTKSVYTDAQRCANIRSSMLRGLSCVPVIPAHDKTMALACFGPSLTETIDRLRAEVHAGADLYTVSGAHRALIERGVIPIGHIESDPRPHKIETIGPPHRDVCYFIASSCARETFAGLNGHETWLYHVTSSNAETELIASLDRNTFTVDGGTNVGMSAIALGTVLGYRKFSIYGMDCSFAVPQQMLTAPRDQPTADKTWRDRVRFHAGFHPNEDQPIYRVWVGDQHCPHEAVVRGGTVRCRRCLARPYITSPQMMQGGQDFLGLIVTRPDCRFTLHGDGMLKALLAYAKPHRAQRAA